MLKLLIKLFCLIDNFSYKVINFLAIRDNGGNHPKHSIMNYHDFFTENIDEDDVVLDIGCGSGSVAYDVAGKARQVVAIDIVEKNILAAKNKFSKGNLIYLTGDATTHEFEENFNVIILSNVLEHIENRIQFLEKIKALSDKFLIRVPLITRDWLAVYKKNIGAEYSLDSTHFIEYTEEDFRNEMKSAGLAIDTSFTKFGELYAIVKKIS